LSTAMSWVRGEDRPGNQWFCRAWVYTVHEGSPPVEGGSPPAGAVEAMVRAEFGDDCGFVVFGQQKELRPLLHTEWFFSVVLPMARFPSGKDAAAWKASVARIAEKLRPVSTGLTEIILACVWLEDAPSSGNDLEAGERKKHGLARDEGRLVAGDSEGLWAAIRQRAAESPC
jgi:hypothetical protein